MKCIILIIMSLFLFIRIILTFGLYNHFLIESIIEHNQLLCSFDDIFISNLWYLNCRTGFVLKEKLEHDVLGKVINHVSKLYYNGFAIQTDYLTPNEHVSMEIRGKWRDSCSLRCRLEIIWQTECFLQINDSQIKYTTANMTLVFPFVAVNCQC